MDQGRGAHSAARPLPPPPKPPRPPRPPRPTGFRTLRKADSVCVPSASSPARPVQQLRKQTSVSCNQPQDGRRFTVQCGDVSYVIDVDSARHDSPVTFYQPRSGPRKSINLADTPVITLSPRRPSLSATTVPTAGTAAAATAAVTTVRPAKPSTSFADAQRQQRNVASKPRKDGAAGDAADAAEAESKKKLAAATCIERLRYILHQLNRGELPLEDLKRNIEYAALVLETAYMDETRRICDEDDDLAEVTPETVPDEVREWLAATFTRQTATTSRQKPKFKSVANAIRTGIFFDKMFRKTQMAQAPIPPEIAAFLKNVNSWSFSSFELNHVSDGHALKYVGFELFNRYGFLDRFKIHYQTLDAYLLALEAGYSKHNNPYHNLVHAADVAQTSHFMLSQTGLANSLGDLELFAVLFGALIHDYEHTGHTNSFHIQSGSNFALLYNDRSVLENHHVSSCFRLMKETDKNILEHLTREEFREFRNMVIEIVLATDMSTHFVQIKTMKNMLSLPEGIDKNKALCLIVHACDISHPAKPWPLHEQWTQGVLEEFFRQGDLEASMGLPYSPLCDRHTTHVAESQIGFIDFIVEPTMVVCSELLTKMVEPLVSIPPHESMSLSTNGTGDNDGGSGSNSAALSPLPDLRGSSPSSVRRLPLTHSGKLEIPNPWTKILLENKGKWKERASKEEAERKAKEAAAKNE